MSKFQCPQAEFLYEHPPEDQAGNSSEGPAWYGLYMLELVILKEASDGFVSLDTYDTTAELNEAWEAIIQVIYPVEEAF
ncbi:hypothetical protein ACIQUL_36085 [Streptomyces sp. NPDC090303]|uniref:hypothetical protein n=1 Tax=Streptomyces sp. NPDC090303 TaxID=3365960 RepID=UPI003809BE78